MLYNKGQIEGSELPIIFDRTEMQFNFDELVNIGENPSDYVHVGYSPVYTAGTNVQLFEKVYEKGE